ncbi:Lrp/AsnC family transcriptional regulator [Pseudonocardiaceae bacterium YIM PH 21723]|nr:Lrp/AsnC family transcriptional regulator [Pseudonocardiaceae bacterium YIM PH 21723]
MTDSPPLDSVDAAIVRELQNNARLPNKELADLVGIAPSTCLIRVRAMRERGVLTGFHAAVDLAAMGRPLRAVIAVRVRPHTREVVAPFLDYVMTLPETIAVSHMAGPDDFLVQVAVADPTHLQQLILDSFTSRREVAQLHTQLVFEHRDKRPVPQRSPISAP